MNIKQNKSKFSFERLSFIEFCALCFIIFIVFVRFLYIFSYDIDFEGVEFALVHFVQKIVIHGNLYSDVTAFPYLLVVHAPFYYYIMAALCKIFSIDVIHDVHQLYILGRTISFILLFIDAYLLLKIIKKVAPSFRYNLIVLAILLLIIPEHFFACRPDSLKITFFLGFVISIINYQTSNKIKYAIISVVILLLATISKQDVLLYGIIIYCIFYITERKSAYYISAINVCVILLFLVLVYYAFSSINLFKQLFLYNVQYDSDLRINLILICSYYARIFPLLYFVYKNYTNNTKLNKQLAYIAILFIVLSTCSMFRIGSNINYTYETSIFIVLNTVVFLKEQHFKLQTTQRKILQLLAIVFFISVFIVNQAQLYKCYFLSKNELRLRDEYENNMKVSEKVKKIIGNNVVFIPNMKYYIFYPAATIIYGSDWHYDRYCELALNIRIKPKFIKNTIVDEYDKQFTNGNVKYILMENNLESEQHITKYYSHYKPSISIDHMTIYSFHAK